jgi:hypothetical protein
LRADGLDAWLGAQLVDGTPHFRIAIGGYAAKADAESAAPEIAARGLEGVVEPIAP